MEEWKTRIGKMKIYRLQQLLEVKDSGFLIQRIEKGFLAFSQGKVNMPPVCHMQFFQPPGDLHIKCASMVEEEFYVVKIASCFPKNSKLGLPSIQGMMILFNQRSGKPEVLFLDEGYLTHLRTAIAGAICAKYLAPKNPLAIGIIGAGQQARFQLKFLSYITSCREVWVWAPNKIECERYRQDETLKDFDIRVASSAEEVAKHCRLIVTTTPSSTPLLFSHDIVKGTHITAVGSDRPGKQELDPAILKSANRIIVDSRKQCFNYGETFHAIKTGMITEDIVDEIGEIIEGGKQGRISESEITVADLTGLGIQDLEIALAFREVLEKTE
jgi:ornithine cyclodeaminase